MSVSYRDSPYSKLLDALDTYREKRDSWEQDASRSGFYDPQGYAEKRAKEEIAKAEKRLDIVFSRLIHEKCIDLIEAAGEELKKRKQRKKSEG